MSNVVPITGALVAGIVGGSLFAAALVAQPRGTTQTAPVPPAMTGMMTSASGASMVMPPGYGPGVMMTSGETPAPAARQSADGLVPLPQPQVAAPLAVREPTLVKYEVETHEVTALMDD